MSSINNSLYYYNFHPYDHSYEAFDSESTRAALEKGDDVNVTDAKTNQLRRTPSLTDIHNLPGPSSTTPNHPPASPSCVSYFDLWDENSFPLRDIPLIGAPDAPQPPPSVLQPLYPCSFDSLEGRWEQGYPSAPVPGPSNPHGIWEGLPTGMYMYADTDEAHGGDILAEVGHLGYPASPFETDTLDETEYTRAGRLLELLKAARGTLPEPTIGPSIPAQKLSAEHTTATSSLSGSDATTELPRRSQREGRAVTPGVEDTQTMVTSSKKGKGKEVVREPATSSTSSMVSRRSKRKREEDVAATVTANPASAPASKKQKMTPEEVGKAMVLPKRLPTKCGCGTKFSERTVAGIVEHFARHYSEREKRGRAKLQCRWGKCATALTYGELVRHVKADHVGARWPCPDCGQQFTRPNGVTRHKKSASACTKNQATAEGRT